MKRSVTLIAIILLAALFASGASAQSIKKTWKKNFRVGAAVEPSQLEGKDAEILKANFNILTPENAMKFTSIHPEDGKYDFTNADAIANFARANHMKIRGHTFVWHHPQTIANWMFFHPDGTQKTREEALAMLEEHMRTLMTRYGDVVYAWDVVNEAFDTGEANGWRRTPWYETIGPDYVEQAFMLAHKIDPKAKLFYNEMITEDPKKIELMVRLLTNFKNKGIQIDGIGLQTHISLTYPTIKAIKDSLDRYSKFGVTIDITELDMTLYTSDFEEFPDGAPEKYLVRQAWRYRELYELFSQYDCISSVTSWGYCDKHSWLRYTPSVRGDWPLFFDDNLEPKLSFAAITGGELPSDVKIEKPKVERICAAHKGTPTIDGKIDAIWNDAEVIETRIQAMGKPGAISKARVLWDESHLYVLAEVADPLLNSASALVHERDSFEIFVDENNGKTSEYEPDDYQYRVCYTGETSASGAAKASMIAAKTVVTETGYLVEFSVPLNSVKGVPGMKLGFDLQVNDADTSATRVGITKWNDPSNESWRNTSGWGVLSLAE